MSSGKNPKGASVFVRVIPILFLLYPVTDSFQLNWIILFFWTLNKSTAFGLVLNGEPSLVATWEACGQRYEYGRGMPRPFRFGKQRLLLAAFQTPEVEHEENWLQIVQLASVQMWVGRELAGAVLRLWERYLPRPESNVAWPGQVQLDWFATRTWEKRATRTGKHGRENLTSFPTCAMLTFARGEGGSAAITLPI